MHVLKELDDGRELRFQKGDLKLVDVHVQLDLRLLAFWRTRRLMIAQLLDPRFDRYRP